MFGDKQFDNLGFPTPESTPDDLGCRLLQIPSSSAWFAVFMGCLSLLADPANWQQYEGGMSRDDAAAVAQGVIDQAYALASLDTCVADVPTPYWDESSADDADDTLPAGEQIWYGEIVALPMLMSGEELTFLDNLGIWLIAGFIAYAGLPGAAIAFVPVAKRFVLAFKQHSVGGIVRALVDFAEVAEIDTYGVADGVVSATIIMPDDGMPHTLYVEMSDTSNPLAGDNPNIQVIRKRLSESEVTPPNTRYNSDCDCIQQSPDGGVTWNNAPGLDPRNSTSYLMPARGGSDPKCDAAANMVKYLKDIIAQAERDVAAFQMATAVLGILAFVLGDVGILADLVLAVVDGLITIGSSEITLAFTDEQWSIIECILYCDSQADGTLTPADLSQVLSDIHDQCLIVVSDVMNLIALMNGFVGLSNAGATGTLTGDCSGCACRWCYEWDFTLNDGGWVADSGLANYVPGIGWEAHVQDDSCSNHAYVYIHQELGFSTSLIDTVQVELTNSRTFLNAHLLEMFSTGTGADISLVADGTGKVWAATSSVLDVYKVGVQLNNCDDASGLIIKKIRVRGNDDMPAFTGGGLCA